MGIGKRVWLLFFGAAVLAIPPVAAGLLAGRAPISWLTLTQSFKEAERYRG